MKTVISNGITLGLDEQTFHVSIKKADTCWDWCSDYEPHIETAQGTVYFKDAQLSLTKSGRLELEKDLSAITKDLRQKERK